MLQTDFIAKVLDMEHMILKEVETFLHIFRVKILENYKRAIARNFLQVLKLVMLKTMKKD